MALSWNKNISFSGLRKAIPKAKETYPSKTYINLTVSDQRSIDLKRVIPAAIIAVILVGVVGKFGVYDFMARVMEKQSELNQQQQVLSEIELQLIGYDTVYEEYQAYVSDKLSADVATVSATEALDLIDTMIAPQAMVTSASFGKNVLSLSLTNISLDALGNLVSALYENPIVKSVTVSTAATSKTAASDVSAAMTITLQRADDDKVGGAQ